MENIDNKNIYINKDNEKKRKLKFITLKIINKKKLYD